MKAKHLLLVVLALCVTLALGSAAPARSQPPTQTQQIFPLVFKDAIQVYVFTGTTTPGTTLRVDTLDCCIAGDSWGVRIFAGRGGGDDDDGDDDGRDDDGGGDDDGLGLGGTGSGDDDDDDDNGGGGRLEQVAEACGNGSTTEFSGEASAQVSGPFVVEVFYCRGVDVFPAGMEVRFRYENGLGAAAPSSTCQDPDKSCEPPGGYMAPAPPGGGGDDDGDDDDDDDGTIGLPGDDDDDDDGTIGLPGGGNGDD
jgi:hypothetical protein